MARFSVLSGYAETLSSTKLSRTSEIVVVVKQELQTIGTLLQVPSMSDGAAGGSVGGAVGGAVGGSTGVNVEHVPTPSNEHVPSQTSEMVAVVSDSGGQLLNPKIACTSCSSHLHAPC